MNNVYRKNLTEPWFYYMENKEKTVEGRLNRDDWMSMNVGDVIIFVNKQTGFKRTIQVKIVQINLYDSFQLYLEKEGLKNCLPGIETMEKGLEIYHKLYSTEEEQMYKVKALHVEIMS